MRAASVSPYQAAESVIGRAVGGGACVVVIAPFMLTRIIHEAGERDGSHEESWFLSGFRSGRLRFRDAPSSRRRLEVHCFRPLGAHRPLSASSPPEDRFLHT